MTRRLPAATLATSGVALLLAAAPLGAADAGPAVTTAPAQAPAQAPAPAAADPVQALLTGTADEDAARATLRLADGTRVGEVRFLADPRGAGTVVVAALDLRGRLRAGNAFHGFHVHANDDPGNGEGCRADPAQPASTWFVSADGHFAAPGQKHGKHRGDLPALYVRRGGGSEAVAVTDRFSPAEVVGRAILLHAGRDNFGNVPVGTQPDQYTPNSPAATDLTARTGNAGDRIACGVIHAD